ncbi:Holliday junction resolvase RuvX [Brevundimonas basaltis]|uniref:Putative pre-16S rRNA nuclease n=1 Tax=Brevundimonas basaltis TaxID=472166 RepID=A0A7W8HXG9_9CAUL|nr:putative Holliday junction resolvase [Brevundimonas basaltis]
MHFDTRSRQSYRQAVTVMTLEELAASTPPGTPWLGLDLGEKTIGVAASDATRMIASPLVLIRKTKFTQDAEAVLKLMDGRNASALIIGLPLNMDGSEGPRAQSCRAFARNLQRLRTVPVAFQDERLSTSAVERFLIEDLDLNRKRRANVVDRTAAAWILQGALDRLRDAAAR